MMKNSSGVAASKGLRNPLRRKGTLQSLTRPMTVAILALGITAAVCHGDEQHSHVDAQSLDEATSPQTECPVMIGDKIDPNIYSDFRGKRVFFCCQSCKAAFAKAPEKYLSRLPQFASVQADAGHEETDASHGEADAGHEEHEHGNDAHEFSLISLVKPTGIMTLSLVALTVGLGLLRRVRRLRPRLLLKLHKIVGFCALGSGAVHATIVLLIH